MGSVVCKFKLTGMKRVAGWNGEVTTDVEFSAVSSGSEENKKFYKYTPSGTLVFNTVNDSAVQALDLGKEYYIVITDEKPAGV